MSGKGPGNREPLGGEREFKSVQLFFLSTVGGVIRDVSGLFVTREVLKEGKTDCCKSLEFNKWEDEQADGRISTVESRLSRGEWMVPLVLQYWSWMRNRCVQPKSRNQSSKALTNLTFKFSADSCVAVRSEWSPVSLLIFPTS